MTYYDYTLHPIYSQQPQQMVNHQQQPLLDWTDPSSEEYYTSCYNNNNYTNNNNRQHHNDNMDEMPSLDDVYEGLFLSFSSDNEEDQQEEAEEEQQAQFSQALAPIIEQEDCDHILDPLTQMSSTDALEDETPLGLNLNIDDELISAFWESYTKIQQSKNLQQVPITPTPATAVNPLQRELPALRLLPLQQHPQQQSFHHQNHSFASSTSTPTTPTTPPTQFCSVQDPTPFHTNLNHNSPLLHQPLQQPTTHIFSYFKHEPIATTAPATATTPNNQTQQSPQLLVQEQVLLMASDERVRCEQSTLETEKHFMPVFDQDKRSMRRETKNFCNGGTLATMTAKTASPSSSRKRSQQQLHHHDGSNDDEQKMFSHFSILPEPAEHDWIQHGKRRKLDSNSNAASSSSHPPSSRHHHQISTTQQSACVNDDVPAATRTRTKSFKSRALSSGGVVTTTTTTTTTTTMTRSASSSNSTTAVVSVEDNNKDTSDSFHVVKQRQVKQQPQLQPFYSFPEEESSFTFVQYDPHMNGTQGLVDGQRMRDKILIPNNRSSNWRKKMKKHDSFMQSFVLK